MHCHGENNYVYFKKKIPLHKLLIADKCDTSKVFNNVQV